MSKKKEMGGLIIGLIAVLTAACFIIIGFLTNQWHPTWMIFLLIPVCAIIVDMIVEGRDIAGSVTGLVAVLAAGVFLIIGFGFGLWHPGWMIFLVIPVVGIVMDIVMRKDFSGVIVGLVAILAAAAFFFLGSVYGLWHIAWVVFLIIPVVAIIVNMVKVATKKEPPDDNQPVQ